MFPWLSRLETMKCLRSDNFRLMSYSKPTSCSEVLVTPLVPARASDDDDPRRGRIEKWRSALQQMTGALRMLDESEAPPDVGAHLDLSIQRLKDEISAVEFPNDV
jgi:hypothetical protein